MQVIYINNVHTRHLTCVVLVDIFWKLDVVFVVDLDKGSWFVLNTLLRSCNFFPVNYGAMVFPGTTICRVMASFHNFMFFIYFSIYCVSISFFCLAK